MILHLRLESHDELSCLASQDSYVIESPVGVVTGHTYSYMNFNANDSTRLFTRSMCAQAYRRGLRYTSHAARRTVETLQWEESRWHMNSLVVLTTVVRSNELPALYRKVPDLG
jgi:hypothetical protein